MTKRINGKDAYGSKYEVRVYNGQINLKLNEGSFFVDHAFKRGSLEELLEALRVAAEEAGIL